MTYVELPCHRLEPGKPVPFNIWDGRGNLLIRKGDRVLSAQHQEILAAHKACVTEADFKAWQRSYDRMVYKLFREGATMEELARSYMPSEILDVDYVVGYDISGGWLDMHEVLSSVLYQGPAARTPLERLDGIQRRATELVHNAPDDSLFTLFQMMPDRALGYCAKHALLAAALCELTAQKLQVADLVRPVLFRAALTMNIGMARLQDTMARQTAAPSIEQQRLIQEHPQRSAEILRGFGVVDDDWLELVGTHHAADDLSGTDPNQEVKRILRMADQFIAKVSARATRAALPARSAVRFMVTQPAGTSLRIGSAMTTAVGFYPPGTYVALSNGETAVVVRRGETASAPVVVSVLNAAGLALAQYVTRDTRDKTFFILAPVSAERLKFTVSNDKVQRALGRVPGGA
jgi:HD-GYP domain-containing protein (c-di-GMP phosphodiesterase class II)